MSASNDTVSEIKTELDELEVLIESSASNNEIEDKISEIKNLLETYESSNPTEESIVSDINHALNDQDLSIEEREELLNTKIKQVEVATDRNTHTKNMLTLFIICNVIILITFISLIVMKATGNK